MATALLCVGVLVLLVGIVLVSLWGSTYHEAKTDARKRRPYENTHRFPESWFYERGFASGSKNLYDEMIEKNKERYKR